MAWQENFQYHVNIEGKKIGVCKTVFLSLHGLPFESYTSCGQFTQEYEWKSEGSFTV